MTDDAEHQRQLFNLITAHDDSRLKRRIKEIGTDHLQDIVQEGSYLSLLHWASLKGSRIIQNWLIDEMNFPVDLDDNPNMWSAAHVAVIGGHESCLEALMIRNPAIVNRLDKKGCTPLHLAAAHGQTHCMAKILKCTTCVPVIDKPCTQNGWTPLMYASWHGRISCVELLIRHGAMTDTVDKEGHTPLHLAASEGHLPLVKYFIEHGCKDILKCLTAVDNNGFTSKMLADFNCKFDIVQFIKEKESDPRTWESLLDIAYPGHIAAMNGDIEGIKRLLNRGQIKLFDVDNRGYSLLHKAVLNNQPEAVAWLLNAGLSIHLKSLANETALDMAKRRNYEEIITFLEKELNIGAAYAKKKKVTAKIFVPILTSLDSTNPSVTFDGVRWNEQVDENEAKLQNLNELINSAKERLATEENELSILETDLTSDKFSTISEHRRQLANIKLEIAKLHHQTQVVQFNLYQLTMEPTLKEVEIGRALGDCEHQFEEVSDQLIYEKHKREDLEAELDKIRRELFRIRDFILTNEVPDELFQMIISFDLNIMGKEHVINVNLNELEINKSKKYSLHFEVDAKNRVTITRLNHDTVAKEISNEDKKNLTFPKFMRYIKMLLNENIPGSKCKRRPRRVRKKTKHTLSPVGGIFITKCST